MPEMTYLQAISDGLREEMRADGRVLLMGEDVGVFGGAFKVSDGFLEEFGRDRVIDTPLAESGIVGTAIGVAVVGMRPVCEMQFADFIACGFDQLVNVAGKMHYRQGLAVPMTVRLPSGGGFSGGPFTRRTRRRGSCTRRESRWSRRRPPRTPREC
jgi:pyruvate/2-oxoglutarate/acetoin dehydrogenase E1 component